MHVETERKYIIEMPKIIDISSENGYNVSEIEQIYLSTGKSSHRIRKRVYGDKTVYTETEKTRISSMSAFESESEISEEKYNNLKKNQQKDTKILVKSRHSFEKDGLVFEIDIYPEWKSTAIMEVELKSEDATLTVPPFIKVIREVTGKREYSNASMSRAFPPEVIK